MKKKLIFLMSLLLLCGCAGTNDIAPTNNRVADMSGYESLQEEYSNRFYEMSLDELEEVLTEGKTATVYLGYEDCHNCQDAINDIGRIAQEKNTYLYYLDAMQLKNDAELERLKDLINEALEENVEGNKTVYTPEVIKIVDGEIIDWKVGSNDLEGYESIIGD